MAKTIRLDPLGKETAIKTNDNLLSGLLKNELNVMQECGGRGMCSTCHVYIKEGMESLSPLNRREKRTLEVITTCKMNSRLACQARVIGDGVVVELPSGMYLSQIDDVESLIGRRAQQNILHPISGKILVEEGKLITRSMITQLSDTKGEVSKYLAQSVDAI
ncbi:2Fe-2S iron-sulfur cluster-binding protein [Cyanobacterium aponinum AL20118]|uniref:Ferredoxin n=3 Tax=Cyanobacterium aponinum TaxID=379064 RepID=K9Z6R3_CYAAP|nr:2Fe-2S iron-sulfur cluster-binding protein [Cyanobacterium aponinum]AFZ54088.1 ferredoxin [Cyanobacterium aponinum PCC 10605]MTF38673.1 2Fe-2S iron-sulfur cluster binding domain-containing protein [Cyanobacterium aponinum 0216]PHV62027.1 (2Fe-2S)-binding protein [Cyanobacterium aponinum IPPAS B-1201]WPF89234.1 2Fe-2S iron-sulfur cluster-binding protein [Cyanobacterium aponinum AL20115]